MVEVAPTRSAACTASVPSRSPKLDGWLATYRGLWTGSLDRLEEHLEHRRNA